jgi:hypothetical protein
MAARRPTAQSYTRNPGEHTIPHRRRRAGVASFVPLWRAAHLNPPMSEARRITCPACGGSTRLPEDLRTPEFQCDFCAARLATANYAGHAAVSADALLGHMRRVVANPPSDARAAIQHAPRFEGGDTTSRAAACRHCGGAVAVPLALHVHTFSCAACGKVQRVAEYISDRDRFELDMKRQVAGNEALLQLQAEGIVCSSCGGKNQVPSDGSVQLSCAFCGTAILLSAYVDASAVARQRLKHGVFRMREEMLREHETRQRHLRRVFLILGILVVVGVVIAGVATR